MKIIKDTKKLKEAISTLKKEGKTITFVPTMGALHEGHISLVKQAKKISDVVIVSIFVNPTQFGPNEDFSRYPRQEEKDGEMLGKAKADILFMPSVDDMYPKGDTKKIEVKGLNKIMCVAFRPGHFDGVATIVNKLLSVVKPDIAIFGEKDWQQLAIVKKMTRDLKIPVKIIGGKTVREKDGLAMSSRNAYLSAEERKIAPELYKTLRGTAARIKQGDPVNEALDWARKHIKEAGFRLDYLELRNEETLEELKSFHKSARLFVAAHLGKTRLIDNMEV